MRLIYTFIVSCLMVFSTLQAQEKKPIITFEKTTHDFGEFAEAVGKVTTEFKFKNTGNAPLLITRTAASCGCTTPTFPKEPIAPGGTGAIKVTYNAKNRPGAFQKTVYVMANTDPDRTKLLIRGDVKRDAKTQKLASYRARVSELLLKSRYLPMFDIKQGEKRVEKIQVYNAGNVALPVFFVDIPKHIRIKAIPQVIPADSEGIIEVTFDASKTQELGMRKDMVEVLVGKDKIATKGNEIIISSEIKEDFSSLSEKDLSMAPKIHIDTKVIDFKNSTQIKTKTIEVANEGKSDLVIHKLALESDAFLVRIADKEIKPGKSTEVEITFHPELAKSKYQNVQVQVISNDPLVPNELLRLHAIAK